MSRITGSAGAQRVEAAQQLEAVHARHLPVGDDDVGAARVERRERGLAAGARLALVAGALERRGDDGRHALLVVDDEDARLHAAFVAPRRGREPEREARAAAGAVADGDRPAVRLDDLTRDGEPEAGAARRAW